MLGKNGINYPMWEVDLCGTFWKIVHWNRLNACCERDQNNEINMVELLGMRRSYQRVRSTNQGCSAEQRWCELESH